MSSAPEHRSIPPTEGWCLYWLACARGRTYVGITNDLAARYRRHCEGKGAKFTRAFKPTGIIAVQPFPDRASASQAEHRLKAKPLALKWEWAREWGAKAPVEG